MATTPRARIDAQDIRRTRDAIADVVRHTPVLSSRTLGERCAGTVVLKAENLQRTGSFKLRGALAKLVALGEQGCSNGVVAASAGNHGQSLAYAARARGVHCEVFMPLDAPISKTDATEEAGATVHRGGETVDVCIAAAQERAAESGMAFVHPFNDPDVIAGQGSVGLELLEDVPDLARIVVPVGGGGLASGIAIAVKSERPDVSVVGVQVAACAPYPESLRRGEPVAVSSAITIADGIAVKRPGDLTLPLIEQWVDDMAVVGEDEVAEAMVMLLERAKLVVEGAGAVGVAGLLGGHVAPAPSGTTVVVLSGGNVDAGLLASVARRHESESGRRLVLFTRLPDRPGALAQLLACVGEAGANLVDVEHVREGVDLHVRETAVQLVLETRGVDHARAVVEAVGAAGYSARVVR
jgi:threonine dehydratase